MPAKKDPVHARAEQVGPELAEAVDEFFAMDLVARGWLSAFERDAAVKIERLLKYVKTGVYET